MGERGDDVDVGSGDDWGEETWQMRRGLTEMRWGRGEATGAMGRSEETPNGTGGLVRGDWEAAVDAKGSGKVIGTPKGMVREWEEGRMVLSCRFINNVVM